MLNLGLVQEISCEFIRRFVGQPRKHFNKQKLEELVNSIREVGQIQPCIVKVLPEGESHKYELVDGERRFIACQILGIPLKAWVREIGSVTSQFLESVVANFGREEHTELEILDAILRIRAEYGFTVEKTAAVFGRSASWVNLYLSLQKLHPSVLNLMSPDIPENQRLTFSHAILLTSLSHGMQIQLAKTVVDRRLKIREVKFLVEKHTGTTTRVGGFSPRKEREIFQNFAQRARIDSDLFLKKSDKEVEDIFQSRSSSEMDQFEDMLEHTAKNFIEIKTRIAKARKSGSKK